MEDKEEAPPVGNSSLQAKEGGQNGVELEMQE
jgi:hypothetical protein